VITMDVQKLGQIASKTLTALVSLRALWRSGSGIQKILAQPKNKAESKTKSQNAVKQKQLYGALKGMGYSGPETDRAMKELSEKIESENLPDLVRAALGILNAK